MGLIGELNHLLPLAGPDSFNPGLSESQPEQGEL